MFNFAWFRRKRAPAEEVLELEEFLRRVTSDERLDEALSETLPASEPIAVSSAPQSPQASSIPSCN